jgi:hypothetical protein
MEIRFSRPTPLFGFSERGESYERFGFGSLPLFL